MLGASLKLGARNLVLCIVTFAIAAIKSIGMIESRRLKDQPASERPRERLAARGADALSHAELIAILLRTGLKGANAVEVGAQLYKRFGSSLQQLAQASIADLQKVPASGATKP